MTLFYILNSIIYFIPNMADIEANTVSPTCIEFPAKSRLCQAPRKVEFTSNLVG